MNMFMVAFFAVVVVVVVAWLEVIWLERKAERFSGFQSTQNKWFTVNIIEEIEKEG